MDILPQLQAGYPLSRQRHHLIRTARGRAGIIFGSRPLIPPSSVPEELIEQVRSIEYTSNSFTRAQVETDRVSSAQVIKSDRIQ